MTNNTKLLSWLDEMVNLVTPDQVIWIDGSEDQLADLRAQSLETGELHKLDQDKLPGCYLHRTAQNDVARVEHRTFICSKTKDEAGPTNNWKDPQEAYKEVGELFKGSMKGRKLYVVPFVMGPPKSPFCKVGVELTDSIYVVLNMAIMTKIGKIALDQIGDDGDFTKCLHARADIDDEKRYILHFPEDNTIWSINSGYGGNVLLGKKCLALRIASYLGKTEGWMAEHMLILGLKSPDGDIKYIAAAFPSACGKTNLAMLIPPEMLKGYEVFTVGDDIAWLRIGEDGRLWAVNPESGFFGVAPGTSEKTNKNALETCKKNTIFTNVVLTDDNNVWWEGLGPAPAHGIDWKGNEWTPESGEKGAHPNARFTAPAAQCPCISPNWEDPQGVPISAIIFGGRRAKTAPLVYQAFDWEHGVFVGSTMASETTTAAIGAVGVVRRDPMAMLPFAGYNIGDYFMHWLEMGKKIPHPPKVFNVNWFRLDDDGKFIWPGFGDNIRILNWIIDRCEDRVDAKTSPIGYMPNADDINTDGLNLTKEQLEDLLTVDVDIWKKELEGIKEFYASIGERLPEQLKKQCDALETRLG